ncbi:MAG: hypothetical protein KIT87_25650 [Anaerolineae bacterium]|nr:hypothetical protein [Anaerolineae bacterium]
MNELSNPRVRDPRATLYQSYLLRLWAADEDGTRCWRASLEDPSSGERIGFANLEELFAFLMRRTEDNTRDRVSPQGE